VKIVVSSVTAVVYCFLCVSWTSDLHLCLFGCRHSSVCLDVFLIANITSLTAIVGQYHRTRKMICMSSMHCRTRVSS